ncbi:hypothetical protein SAMN04489796_11512 [Winogradskyella thalassocola]|uniref:Uncharacterized protein n=1 Tax=Winogradskyella thalassocola TaxID=262004 RepID=A0A1G8M0T6_9FLAO|nr:hypothetical protein SAMN04489796_11512 [Winogradskyella thalassocola]
MSLLFFVDHYLKFTPVNESKAVKESNFVSEILKYKIEILNAFNFTLIYPYNVFSNIKRLCF